MPLILITGADGQLGSEIKIAARKYYGYDFIFTDINDLDITSSEDVSRFIVENRPDWIVNCAAWNNVDKAESEPGAAMLVNSFAVKNISEAIAGSDKSFIHISSDYVFDGSSALPYTENDNTEPGTEYGRSKLAGEKAALMHNRAMVIRTSWLYSAYGNNFVKTILRKAKETDHLRVVFDQAGTPTWAADLAETIMNIISSVIRNRVAFNAGIYHFSNEGVCSWYDLAIAIIEEAGLSCGIQPIRSAEFASAAMRPAYSVLDKTKIKENYNIEIAHWRSSLKKCIKQISP
ncbi:MAG TPA: dTDP-4-dehydrorhamnose reductase [Bacteroidales bacterium]|nr:dTDP-4-dehydrorhamnose reductase [Bacteroidales bacterium]HPF03716.1 dTDP-4-dehydrorhamnose reductase [Bacteroidales bacterium]HPJ60340.1 dTDP-4-dehydrorhamnose reductase [Bacteroidales bacterium]HPR10756.1 dTDP-4-dehydrorhamnose reductase [Bacteroidales bacterium]HRW85941.1 dTDP-4-dehydrorhamnose reductase [Bacteroidales bacterium]